MAKPKPKLRDAVSFTSGGRTVMILHGDDSIEFPNRLRIYPDGRAVMSDKYNADDAAKDFWVAVSLAKDRRASKERHKQRQTRRQQMAADMAALQRAAREASESARRARDAARNELARAQREAAAARWIPDERPRGFIDGVFDTVFGWISGK